MTLGSSSILDTLGEDIGSLRPPELAPSNKVSGEAHLAEKKEREDRNLRTRLQTEQSGFANAGLLTFLMIFFTGMENDKSNSLDAASMIEQVSSFLGLDASGLTHAVSAVKSGQMTARQAAHESFERIEPDRIDWSKGRDIDVAALIRNGTPTMFHPDLVTKMESDPKVRQMVQWTVEAAEKHGLDGKLLANQFYIESGFKPKALSGKGASGIAQVMPGTARDLGYTPDQLKDPRTSIECGAKYMAQLTQKYESQHLAMVAYNGGGKAITFVEGKTGQDVNDLDDWMQFTHRDRQARGIGPDGSWRKETFGYISKIDSNYWDEKTLARAEAKQKSVLGQQFAKGGVAEVPKPVQVAETAPVTEKFAVSSSGINAAAAVAAQNNDTRPSESKDITNAAATSEKEAETTTLALTKIPTTTASPASI